MRGINLCQFGGNLAADPELRTIETRNKEKVDLIEFSMYVDESARKNSRSFIVKVTVWQNTQCFTAAGYLRKGSEVAVIGSLSSNPYIAKTDNSPRAGLQLNCIQLVLGRSPRDGDIQATDEPEMPF